MLWLLTFEPLDGFSNFKKVNDSIFSQQFTELIKSIEIIIVLVLGGHRKLYSQSLFVKVICQCQFNLDRIFFLLLKRFISAKPVTFQS